MNLRIKLIQSIIHLNEYLIFYPKLKAFYSRFLTQINSNNSVFVDVGANKGQSIDFFLKLNSKATIYAFEPNPSLFKFLQNKYKNYPNIHLFNLGISNQKGKLLLNETVTNETSTFEELNYDSQYLQYKANVLGVKKEELVSKSYFVEVIQLSDFIKEQNLTKIDILKIDTEGHELKCLQGLFNHPSCEISFIQLEKHTNDMFVSNQSVNEVPQLLQENGFNSFTEIKHGFGKFVEVIYEKAHI